MGTHAASGHGIALGFMSGGGLPIVHSIAPARTGGAETVVTHLTGGLRALGHDVHVALVLEPGQERDHPLALALSARGVPLHVVSVTGRAYGEERRAIGRVLDSVGAQLLHTHGYRADVMHGGVAKARGIPHVMTLHGFVGLTRRGRFYEWLQVRAARRASRAICVSEAIAQRVRTHDPRGVAIVVPNAAFPEPNPLLRDAARQALGLAPDANVVGWVGRFSHEKGPDLFLDALAKSARPVTGVMIGDGPLLGAMREYAASLGIVERVRFAGALPSASRYFPAFDLLALTSRTEGTPMVLLEAMHQRVPIVATAVGGVPALLGADCAALVMPGDTQALTAAFAVTLDRDGITSARATRALERVHREYSAQSWLHKHQALYLSVLAEKRAEDS